ncbi:hypothetical protein F5Y18DRAFT_109701 [Xylariaceae sp. FL1019]|nr:hypothetical protein F5Y18DRAFT_109701 [Xylariaceae sp. FL1019]
MPSRISLPKLSLFSARNTPAAIFTPSSPTKKSCISPPLTPPARLHLRNILPASPLEPFIMPPPPRTPGPWLWQCHHCRTIYRLGCTRRCLQCSHTFCVGQANKPNNLNPGKKRRRDREMCPAEFDFPGWEQWGSWRRKVLGRSISEEARDRAFVKRTHNCERDCDFPNHCIERRMEIARQERMAIETIVEEEEENEMPVLSGDDELRLNVPRAVDEDTEAPTSPGSESSFYWDEIEPKKKRRVEDKVWWVEEEGEEREEPMSRLRVRNLTEGDVLGDSESESESESDSEYENEEDEWDTESEDEDEDERS